ncbi:MAG: ArsC/Spx/MgsR family protein, partial [Oscillospiraceae bacterium]
KLLENPCLLQTPLVRNGKCATVGYQPEKWKLWE